MEIHTSIENISHIKKPVVTTGTFDGVHMAHKAILKRLRLLADQIEGSSVLITFYPHPRKVLYPESAGKELQMINTQNEKATLLQQTKLDHVIIIPFTKAFSAISSQQFVKEFLVDKLQVKRIVVGFNHYFGHNREGNYTYLNQLKNHFNFDVEELPKQDLQNETISSTKIRNAIQEGNIQRANAYLSHYYFIQGTIISGEKKQLDVSVTLWKIDCGIEEKLLPPEGVYAISTIVNKNIYKGMAFITNSGNQRNKHLLKNTFVYLFDFYEDVSGLEIIVNFHTCIRSEDIFSDNTDIQTQIYYDRKHIETLIY